MSNTLGYYNPYFYANEALIHLRNALGMASRVHMGFDAERRAFNKGEYVNIRKPSTFTATDVVSSSGGTTADLATESVQVQLSNWKEVKFSLTDKELSFTSERIISDHIAPAAYALANDIDSALCDLYKKVPATVYIASGSVAATSVTQVWEKMFDMGIPMNDVNNLHFMVNGNATRELLDETAFTSWSVAGDNAGPNLINGTLGRRYGFNFFSNQNVKTHTGGVYTDGAGAIDSGSSTGYAKGTTTVHIDALTSDDVFAIGDSFYITGYKHPYALTSAVTITSSAEADFAIYPDLHEAIAENAVVTFGSGGTTKSGYANLAFHKNAFALVTAPLSDMGNELGAKIAVVQDPVTGLSLRSRIWYEGDYSRVKVGLDVLYGVQVLDGHLACRLLATT